MNKGEGADTHSSIASRTNLCMIRSFQTKDKLDLNGILSTDDTHPYMGRHWVPIFEL
jgi:hypothetical protein